MGATQFVLEQTVEPSRPTTIFPHQAGAIEMPHVTTNISY
jgi:hypothetical protein